MKMIGRVTSVCQKRMKKAILWQYVTCVMLWCTHAATEKTFTKITLTIQRLGFAKGVFTWSSRIGVRLSAVFARMSTEQWSFWKLRNGFISHVSIGSMKSGLMMAIVNFKCIAANSTSQSLGFFVQYASQTEGSALNAISASAKQHSTSDAPLKQISSEASNKWMLNNE